MASSWWTHPSAETHDTVHQYLDQRLTDLSRSFQTQVDALAEQMRHLTATPPSLGFGPAAGGLGSAPTPADHTAAFHRHPPRRWPPGNLPPPRHGTNRPAAVDRHVPGHVRRDVHPYLYDRPLFGPSSRPATCTGPSGSFGLKPAASPVFGAGFGSSTSPSSGFSFGSSGNGALAFGSTSTGLPPSGSSMFFNSSTTSSGSFPAQSSVFTMSNQPAVGFGSTTIQNDQMDHLAVPPGAPVFQFCGHQNAPGSTQPPSLFSPPGGAPTGSFSLGTGGSDKSNRRIFKARRGKSRRR